MILGKIKTTHILFSKKPKSHSFHILQNTGLELLPITSWTSLGLKWEINLSTAIKEKSQIFPPT